MQTIQLSRLMRLSWQIQKSRKYNRSKSLLAEWSIYLNEDSTVFHLVQKHSGTKNSSVTLNNLTLFHQ